MDDLSGEDEEDEEWAGTAALVIGAGVDVLAEPEIRQNLPLYSNWPTFPQVFINGELVGGCDIVMQLHENGKLKKMTKEAVVI